MANLEKEDWDKQWREGWRTQEDYWNSSYAFKRIREEIKRRLRKKRIKICEFGAGGGLWLKWLKEEFHAEVYGVDNSKEGLKIAKRRVPTAILKLGDVKKVPFKSNYFDFVYGLGLIEHFNDKDIQKIINESYRTLKKSGICIITVPNRSKWSGLWIWEGIFGRTKSERIIEPEELEGFFKKAGFKKIGVFPGGLFVPKLRNKRWFSRLNLKFLENFKTSDYILGFGIK